MSISKAYSYCNVVGMTDVGCKRKANEDWLDDFECPNGLVSVVCDGMGGHVGGQIASHLAVETIKKFLTDNYFENPKEAIIAACDAANVAILCHTQEKPELTGMGSTCVMLIVRDGKVYIGSVGDSRVYLVRSRIIRQLTKDQSYVQMLVDAGQISPEEAEHHPRKNEITNALGLQGMRPATVLEDPINPEAGDCFLLCSDGLSGMVSDREIAKVVSNQMGMSQQERVSTLIQKARTNGGLDNITCQIVEFAVTPGGDANKAKPVKTFLKFGMPAIVLALILVVGSYFLFVQDDKNDSSNISTEQVSIESKQSVDILILGKDKLELSVPETGKLKFTIKQGEETKSYIYPDTVDLCSMEIIPAKGLLITQDGDVKYISFKSDEFDGKEIELRFKRDDNRYKVYCFGVTKPKIDTGKKGGNAKADSDEIEPEQKEQAKSGKNTGDVLDNTIPDNECTFDVSKNAPKTVTLYSTQGTNTINKAFFDGYKFSGAPERTTPWYKLSHDTQKCTIELLTDMMPETGRFIDIDAIHNGKTKKIRINFKVKE